MAQRKPPGVAEVEELQRHVERSRKPARLDDYGDVLNCAEAAAVLRISPNHLREYSLRGEIPARRLGSRWLYPKAELAKWIAGETTIKEAE